MYVQPQIKATLEIFHDNKIPLHANEGSLRAGKFPRRKPRDVYTALFKCMYNKIEAMREIFRGGQIPLRVNSLLNDLIIFVQALFLSWQAV